MFPKTIYGESFVISMVFSGLRGSILLFRCNKTKFMNMSDSNGDYSWINGKIWDLFITWIVVYLLLGHPCYAIKWERYLMTSRLDFTEKIIKDTLDIFWMISSECTFDSHFLLGNFSLITLTYLGEIGAKMVEALYFTLTISWQRFHAEQINGLVSIYDGDHRHERELIGIWTLNYLKSLCSLKAMKYFL